MARKSMRRSKASRRAGARRSRAGSRRAGARRSLRGGEYTASDFASDVETDANAIGNAFKGVNWNPLR